MTDCFSPEQRSAVMRAVGREDTPAEVNIRRALWHEGVRYRTHRPTAGAKPDICVVAARVAIFVDGCFWDGCPKHYTSPEANAEFWRRKLERNQARDRRNDRDLREAGWEVLRFWECEVNENLEEVVKKVRKAVSKRT